MNVMFCALEQPVDFREVMSAREQLFWNSTLEQLLLACPDEAAVQAVFARLAGVPALQVRLLKPMGRPSALRSK
jgi:hypothetical protein